MAGLGPHESLSRQLHFGRSKSPLSRRYDQTYDGRHVKVTDLLGILCEDSKDIYGTVLPYSAMTPNEIDTNMFTFKGPDDKLVEARMPPPKLLEASLNLSEANRWLDFSGFQFCAPTR